MILIPSPLELFWQNEERNMFGSNHIVTVDKNIVLEIIDKFDALGSIIYNETYL